MLALCARCVHASLGHVSRKATMMCPCFKFTGKSSLCHLEGNAVASTCAESETDGRWIQKAAGCTDLTS